MSQYKNYDEVLDKGFKQEDMSYRDKKRLIQQIDKLEMKDHLGILRIIMDSTDKKIYTVNNYGTYIDLADLDNKSLWQVSYFVNLCLENQNREKERTNAEKKHLEKISQLEKDLKNGQKLKLTPQNISINNRKTQNDDSSEDDSSENESLEQMDELCTKMIQNPLLDEESDLPTTIEPDLSEFEEQHDGSEF